MYFINKFHRDVHILFQTLQSQQCLKRGYDDDVLTDNTDLVPIYFQTPNKRKRFTILMPRYLLVNMVPMEPIFVSILLTVL